MRAALTGGTGFVGGAIARRLVADGIAVRALVRRRRSDSALEDLGIETARGDILAPPTLEAAFAGCDVLFHAAAIYEFWITDPAELTRTEVEGTRNVLDAAIKAGIRNVVYTSTAVCVGEARGTVGNESTPHRGYFLTPYEEAKWRAEQVVLSYRDRLNIAIIRPAAVIGPGDLKPTGQLIINLANGKMPGIVRGKVSLVDIDDVALAHVEAARRARYGETYVVSSHTRSVPELAAMVCRYAGRFPPITTPRSLALALAAFLEWRAGRTGRPPILTRSVIRLVSHGFCVDGAKAARELGLAYRSLEESLGQALTWYWDQGLLTRVPYFLRLVR